MNSVHAKNSKLSENKVSPNFQLKRKFDQIENLSHQEEIITQTKYLIYKIDELYEIIETLGVGCWVNELSALISAHHYILQINKGNNSLA